MLGKMEKCELLVCNTMAQINERVGKRILKLILQSKPCSRRSQAGNDK